MVNSEFVLETNGGSLSGPLLGFPVWEPYKLSVAPFPDDPVWQGFAFHLSLRPAPAVAPKRSLVLDIYSSQDSSFWLRPTPGKGFLSAPMQVHSFGTEGGQFNFPIGYQF
jgi:hypothetical protein